MLFEILLGVSCTLVTYVIIIYWQNRKLFLLTSKLPGPVNLPIIGAVYKVVGKKPSNYYQIIQQLYVDYPDESVVFFGPNCIFLLKSPENFQIVFNSSDAYQKTDIIYQWTKTLGETGLIGAPVDIWKKHRKIANYSFNHNILKKSVQVMADKSEIFAENLLKFDNHQIYGNYITCTADITAQSLLDYDLDYQSKKPAFGDLMWQWLEISYTRIFKIWCHIDFLFKFTPEYKMDQYMRKELDIISNMILENKETEWNERLETEESKKSLLDNLFEGWKLKSILTSEEIRHEIHTFLLAGAETTANAGCFTLMALGMHPEVQEKVYNEILEVVGTNNLVQVEDLPKLKYTEQTIKETLRLFPVIPMIARFLTKDLTLDSGVVAPKGTNVALSFFHCQRDEKYWPDPLKFDPDRFSAENSINRHINAFSSFSGGARNCIGHRNAIMVLKCNLVSILTRYRVFSDYKSVEDVELKMNVMSKPTKGYRLSFKPRIPN